jgi:enediyne biosynthesis protein E7
MTLGLWLRRLPLPLSPTSRPSRAAVPGPRGLHLLAGLRAMRRDRLGFVLRAAEEYGDIALFRLPGRPLFLVNHPAGAQHVLRDNARGYVKGAGLIDAGLLLGKGLLTSEGAQWAAQRRLVHPVMTPGRMRQFAEQTVAAATRALDCWQEQAAGVTTLDVGEAMAGLTLDVLGHTLLRGPLATQQGLAECFDEVQRWALQRMAALVRLPLRLPTPANRRTTHALQKLRAFADALIEFRRHERLDGSPGGDGDTLDALLLANGGAATGVELRAEVLTLLLAGHETTAAALAWVWHLLAHNPAARDRLEAELDGVLAGRAPGFDDVPQLAYTKMVVQETLRLYPPVWMLSRRALAADEVLGHRVPSGADVLVSPYSLHRHPRYWEEPDEFRPERFAAGGPPHPAAYMPFGLGPRACLGSAFGLLEVVLAVATVAQACRFDRPPSAPQTQALALLTLKPLHLELVLSRRCHR